MKTSTSNSFIEQLDGLENGTSIQVPYIQDHNSFACDEGSDVIRGPDIWPCKCCPYAHSFQTEDELKEHHDTLMFKYDECSVCYPWHEWI